MDGRLGPKHNVKPYCHKGKEEGVGVLGSRLKAERLRRGWTLSRFASETNIHITQLTGFENRGVYPTLRHAMSIAQVLECSIDWLVGLED